MPPYRQYILTATLIFTLILQSCAALFDNTQPLGGIFKGNTKRNPNNYNLEDKAEYRKYRYEKKLQQEYEEKEILKRMEVPAKIKSSF